MFGLNYQKLFDYVSIFFDYCQIGIYFLAVLAIGRSIIHKEGIEVIRKWIESEKGSCI